MAKQAIDPKYLAGLTFKSSKPGKEGGHVPTERDLTVDDVLDWKDNGTSVTIVAADGRKHVVSKSDKPDKSDKK